MLIDTEDPDPVESLLVIDQDPSASANTASFAVSHATLSNPSNCEVLNHEAFQHPPQHDGRESFARGSAAFEVSWRHTWPQSGQR